MPRPRRAVLRAAACVTLVFAPRCARHLETFQDSFLAMDSVVEVTVVAASPAAAQRAFAIARREVDRLEGILSDFLPDSNVGRLNRRRTDVLAPETRFLLERSQIVCHETGGAFDITLRPIKRLWGFGTGGTPHVPDSSQVAALVRHVGCDTYSISADGRFAWRDSLAELDFGGIAQGYVGQCVRDSLRSHGFQRFLVNISGDIVASGRRRDGKPWQIGIQNPRRPDSLVATLPLDVQAVTTSGDYEQYFEANGVRYHHIFDPVTGRPARGLAQVTVLSDDPVLADCMTKAVFVLGPVDGLTFLNERPDLRGVLVREAPGGGLQLLWSDSLRAQADVRPAVAAAR